MFKIKKGKPDAELKRTFKESYTSEEVNEAFCHDMPDHPYSRLMKHLIDVELFDSYQKNLTPRNMKYLMSSDMENACPSNVLVSSFVYERTIQGLKFWQYVQDKLPINL